MSVAKLELTINSRKLGQVLTFTRPNHYYVYLSIDGAEPVQICDKGKFSGSVLGYCEDSPDKFANICKNWYRQYTVNLQNL